MLKNNLCLCVAAFAIITTFTLSSCSKGKKIERQIFGNVQSATTGTGLANDTLFFYRSVPTRGIFGNKEEVFIPVDIITDSAGNFHYNFLTEKGADLSISYPKQEKTLWIKEVEGKEKTFDCGTLYVD